MKTFTICDAETSEIIRTGSCPESMLSEQVGEDEILIVGSINERTQKIVDRQIVDKSDSEIEDYDFNQIKDTFPIIDLSLNDADLNISISQYFLGRVDVARWRIDNYRMLRKLAYPDITVFNDAQVKINSGDSNLAAEGNAQLSQYYVDCLAVKTRFPKE